MFIVLYQDNLTSTDTLSIYDETDGEVTEMSKENLHNYLLSNPSVVEQFSNAKVDGGELRLKPITLPLTLTKADVQVKEEGSQIIITHKGESAKVDWSETKNLVGFNFTSGNKEINFYVYDKADGKGQRIKTML